MSYYKIPLYFIFFINTILFSKEKTFIREYTYSASEYDSKVNSRGRALEQVKTILLEEVSVYIQSEFTTRSKSKIVDGNSEVKEYDESNISIITAGVTKTEILDEKWNGELYWIKAKITIDENDMKDKVAKISKNKEAINELKKLKKEHQNQSKLINKLSKELKTVKDRIEKDSIKKKYSKAILNLEAKDWYLKARTQYQIGKYENAIKYFKNYINNIDNDTEISEVHISIAESYLALDEKNEAIKAFEKAVKIYPLNSLAFYRLGVLYEKDYDFQKAISYYLNSINADKKYHEAYHRLGVCQSKINRYSESIRSLKKAIEMHRGKASHYHSLGVVYQKMDSTNQAKKYLRISAKLGNINAQKYLLEMGENWLKKNKNEQDAIILFQKGYNFHSIKDYGNAIKKYKESLQFNPINKSVYFNLALCYHNLNKWQEAMPFYVDAANLGHEGSIKFLREYYFNNGLEFTDEFIREYGWN